jgi:hypothetical protein
MALSFPQLLQKNGQLSTANGLSEQGDLSSQEGAPTGQEEEVTVTDGKRSFQDWGRTPGAEGQTALSVNCGELCSHIFSAENTLSYWLVVGDVSKKNNQLVSEGSI